MLRDQQMCYILDSMLQDQQMCYILSKDCLWAGLELLQFDSESDSVWSVESVTTYKLPQELLPFSDH